MKTGPSIPGRKLPNALPRFFWITFALTLGLWAARPARAQPTDLAGSSPPAAEEWRVVERGQDFAVFQRFRARTQADGSLHWQPGGLWARWPPAISGGIITKYSGLAFFSARLALPGMGRPLQWDA
jgi:hypothetical protein